jgi:hypothetical protein
MNVKKNLENRIRGWFPKEPNIPSNKIAAKASNLPKAIRIGVMFALLMSAGVMFYIPFMGEYAAAALGEVPWNVIGFAFVLLAVLLTAALYKAEKTKNKQYYMVGGVCCSMALVVVVAVLGQYILSFVLLFATAIFSAAMLPRMLRISRDETVESIKSTDASAPLRFKDFFSGAAIAKLERKYGSYKSILIFAAVGTSMVGAVMLLMTLLGIITLPMAGFYTAVAFVLYIAIYLRFKKDVKEGRIGIT